MKVFFLFLLSIAAIKSFGQTDDELVFTNVDQNASFPGGSEAFSDYLRTNLQYPDKAVKKKIVGQVYVQLVIDKQGRKKEISAIKGIGFGCDVEAVRIIKESPNWIPAIHEGQIVNQRLVIPIIFKLDSKTSTKGKKRRKDKDIKTEASFAGGKKAFVNYLKGNLEYPSTARHKGIEGEVNVQFIVHSDGTISDVKAMSKIGGGCENEAVRLIKKSPPWTPAILKDGTPVEQIITLPIPFKLK